MFYVRVISGYEERRIRSMRLAMEHKLKEAQAKRAALYKLPEQVILSEVRNLVTQMQSLNKKLEETDAAFGKYFETIDKGAGKIMDLQQKGEEQRMKEMMKIVQEQASQRSLQERTELEQISDKHNADGIKDKASS